MIQNITRKNKRTAELLKTKHEIAISNYKLLNAYNPLIFTQKGLFDTEYCYSFFKRLKTAHFESGEILEHNHARKSCKKKWCPLCAFDLAKKWYVKLLPITQQCKNLYFITLTWPNIYFKDLVDTRKNIEKILMFDTENDFKITNKAFHYLKKKNPLTKSLFKNNVRKCETTINYFDKSYNFHYHLLVSLDQGISNEKLGKVERELSETWTDTFKFFFPKVEIKTKDGLCRVEIQKVKKDKVNNELTAYVSKDSVKSFKKEDILKDLELRLQNCKRDDLKQWLQENIKAVSCMSQNEITELQATWFFKSKGMRVFNISGFKNITQAVERKCWNDYKFVSYGEFSKFELVNENDSELDYLIKECSYMFDWNLKRKSSLTREQVIDKVLSRVKFKVSVPRERLMSSKW